MKIHIPTLTNRLIILLLALLVTAAFFNSLLNDFTGDDKALYKNNQFYKETKNLSRLFSRDFVMFPTMGNLSAVGKPYSGFVSYRPVCALTFFADYALWKDLPMGHHFSNVLLHLFAVLLVFYFVLRISADNKLAFLTAAIFAVHPVQTEAVNTMGYRSDILMAIFFLSGLLGYFRYLDKRKPGWLVLVGAVYFLGLFSKEAMLAFPIVLFITGRFFAPREKPFKQSSSETALYFGLAVITVFYLYAYFFLIPNPYYLQKTPHTLTGLARAALMLKMFGHYISVILNPASLSVLPPLYAPPLYPLRIWELLVPVFVILAACISMIYFYSRNRPVTFGLIWFFIIYLPVSGIVPLLNPLSYRFLYLPSVGLFLAAAVALRYMAGGLEKKGSSLKIGLLVQTSLIGLLAALTIAANVFYSNNIVCCREMIRRFPEGSRPYWILGLENFQAGNRLEAVKYLSRYLEIPNNNPFISSDKEKVLTYHLLGKASLDPDTAISYLKKALVFGPGFAELYLDLSRNYIAKKDFVPALDYARKAAVLDPNSPLPYVFIVHIDIQINDLQGASAVLAQAKKRFAGDEKLTAVERVLTNKVNEK